MKYLVGYAEDSIIVKEETFELDLPTKYDYRPIEDYKDIEVIDNENASIKYCGVTFYIKINQTNSLRVIKELVALPARKFNKSSLEKMWGSDIEFVYHTLVGEYRGVDMYKEIPKTVMDKLMHGLPTSQQLKFNRLNQFGERLTKYIYREIGDGVYPFLIQKDNVDLSSVPLYDCTHYDVFSLEFFLNNYYNNKYKFARINLHDEPGGKEFVGYHYFLGTNETSEKVIILITRENMYIKTITTDLTSPREILYKEIFKGLVKEISDMKK